MEIAHHATVSRTQRHRHRRPDRPVRRCVFGYNVAGHLLRESSDPEASVEEGRREGHRG